MGDMNFQQNLTYFFKMFAILNTKLPSQSRILYLNILNPLSHRTGELIAVNCSSLPRVLFQSHDTGLVQVVYVYKAGKTSTMETNGHQIWVYRKNSSKSVTLKIIVQVKLHEHGISK